MSTLIDQAESHTESDKADDIKFWYSSVGMFASRGSFEPSANSKQDSIGEKNPLERGAIAGFSTQMATIRQDGTADSISPMDFLTDALMAIFRIPSRWLPYKRQAGTSRSDVTACGNTILRPASLSSTYTLLPFLRDTSRIDVVPRKMKPLAIIFEPSMSQPCCQARRSLFRRTVGFCNPFERERPEFPRKIVAMVSYFLDTSFGTILPSPLILLKDVRKIHRRQSTGKRSLRSPLSPWAFIVVLTSVMSPAAASPIHNAEVSSATTPKTPMGLYFACGIPVTVGIICCCLTWKYGPVSSCLRNCLGVLSLMASIVWTCLVHWDTAPNFRKVVLAFCHGLVYNFTLQLCMSRYGRLLSEAWAINVGFPVAALLLDFLDTLLVGQEPATMPSSVADLVWSGFLRWATSPLHFTLWAIMVKVAFYTCDVVVNRHTLPTPNTLLGRCAVRIALSVEKFYGRVFPTAQQHRTDQGRITANRHNTVIGDGDVELGGMRPDMALDDEQSNGNNQASPVEVSSSRTQS